MRRSPAGRRRARRSSTWGRRRWTDRLMRYCQLPYIGLGSMKYLDPERGERLVVLLHCRLAEVREVQDVVAEKHHELRAAARPLWWCRRSLPRSAGSCPMVPSSGRQSIMSYARRCVLKTASVSAHSDSNRFVTMAIRPPRSRTRVREGGGSGHGRGFAPRDPCAPALRRERQSRLRPFDLVLHVADHGLVGVEHGCP